MQITLPQKQIPVRDTASALVVGGGPAGIGADVASARMGFRTTLLEKRGFLGGRLRKSK